MVQLLPSFYCCPKFLFNEEKIILLEKSDFFDVEDFKNRGIKKKGKNKYIFVLKVGLKAIKDSILCKRVK